MKRDMFWELQMTNSTADLGRCGILMLPVAEGNSVNIVGSNMEMQWSKEVG